MVKEPTTDELSAQPEYLTEEARQAAVDEIAGLKIIYKDYLDAHDGAPPTNKECTKIFVDDYFWVAMAEAHLRKSLRATRPNSGAVRAARMAAFAGMQPSEAIPLKEAAQAARVAAPPKAPLLRRRQLRLGFQSCRVHHC